MSNIYAYFTNDSKALGKKVVVEILELCNGKRKILRWDGMFWVCFKAAKDRSVPKLTDWDFGIPLVILPTELLWGHIFKWRLADNRTKAFQVIMALDNLPVDITRLIILKSEFSRQKFKRGNQPKIARKCGLENESYKSCLLSVFWDDN